MHYTWRVDQFYCVFETIISSSVCYRKTFTPFCHRKGFMGNYNVFFFYGSFSIHSDTKLFRTIYKKTFNTRFSIDQSIYKWRFTVFILFYFYIYFSYTFIVFFISKCTQIWDIWLATQLILFFGSVLDLLFVASDHIHSAYIWLSTFIRDQRRKEILLHLLID